MQAEQERKRHEAHERRRAELEASQQPFRFPTGTPHRDRHDACTIAPVMPDPKETAFKVRMIRRSTSVVMSISLCSHQATPIPPEVLDTEAWEKVKEQEYYRRMKLRVRAEESLKKSQLPPRMAARGLCKVYFLLFIDNYSQKDAEFNDISRRKAFLDEMERSAALTDKPKFQPQIHHSVPDFKQLQADFETTLTLKKQSRPKTTPKPFSITDAKGKSDAAARLAKVPSTLNGKYIFTSQDHAGNRA